ncbi:MAG: M3 family oligoendopeptidase [Anaerolineaceae bacterium]|jgi:oligoendopeptidase F|nr:M3 family oligoendopeptidase [Anaerolineaceae bacterium]
MFEHLPTPLDELMTWNWEQFAPFYQELNDRSLTAKTLEGWMQDWSLINKHASDLISRIYVAVSQNTADEKMEQRLHDFMDNSFPQLMAADQKLKDRLLDSGLEPDNFTVQLRNMRADQELFREENLSLLAEENKQSLEYDKIIGAQTVEWQGEEVTVASLTLQAKHPDRAVRQQAWELEMERRLQDRQAINENWQKLLKLRLKIAANAGFKNYRDYQWKHLHRFDYTAEDSKRFGDAIQEVVVPAANRIYARYCEQLGIESLRPWDRYADTSGRPPLKPFETIDELQSKTSAVFHQVDPQLGDYFDTMIAENLLDLDNRKNKAPGGYCTEFALDGRPFIFTNAVGIHDNVQTLLHEGGHSFHVFESAHLPYIQQWNPPMEFAEVASMSMEFLSMPYLAAENGGFYTEEEAARAFIENLEYSILFWPYMAVVDGFQHWVYENPAQALDADQCDAAWGRLWDRFMPGEDWSGLEDAKVTGWHRKGHIHGAPFYYVEYGLAQLGAVQVWRNSLSDQKQAVADYRKALSLGGTRTLPQLFQAAGARLAFDAPILRESIDLMEGTLADLYAKIG